jgi:ribosomal protein S18 acetylase RimI-like enzyme
VIPLDPADIPAFAAALVEIDPWKRLGYKVGQLARYLAMDDPHLIRMTVPGQGLISLRTVWLRGPYIELLTVLPHAQGTGIGRQMVEWAASQGGDNLWACVSAFNASARAFYARMGFVETAILSDLVKPGEDEILLRRTG